MAPCKFYMQGFCRFGNSCRFEHVDNHGSHGYTSFSQPQAPRSYSTYRQGGGYQAPYKFSSVTATVAGNTQSTGLSAALTLKDVLNNIQRQELIQHVSADMQTWDEINMWPLSCCSYWKDGDCIPGFQDWSPEELRLDAYEANQSGNIASYQQRLSTIMREYHDMRQKFIHISSDDKRAFSQFLEQEKQRVNNMSSSGISNRFDQYKSQFSTSNFTTNNAFQSSASNAFQSTTSNAFQSPSNAFQSPTNAFQSPVTTNKAVNPQTLFGKPSNQSSAGLFTGNQSGGGLFGKQSTVSGTGFGTQQNTRTSTPVFPSTPSFGMSPISGTPSPVNADTLFTRPNNTTSNTAIFGSNAANTNIFGANSNTFGSLSNNAISTTSNAFGVNSNTNSNAFGVNSTNSNTFGTNSGLFGANVNPATNVFGSNSNNATNIFGSSNTNTNSNGTNVLFGKPQATLFGKPTTTATNFASPQQQSVQQITTNVEPLKKLQNSVLIAARDTLYTVLADLTEIELSQFNAPTFTLGKIPTRPPPKELC